jgi:hypothetical protein
MQPEFSFVKPFDDAIAVIKQREVKYWDKFIATLNKFFPNQVSISEIFKDLPPIDFSDDPSIPMTFVLGPIGQYEFEDETKSH